MKSLVDIINESQGAELLKRTADRFFGDVLGKSRDLKNTISRSKIVLKEIADKLMRARQRVAAQKQAEQGSGSAFAQYVSMLTVGLGSMSLGDCLNLTVYQMYDLVERYSLYINWDIDMKSRLAGAKPDKPVDNWMKQIH